MKNIQVCQTEKGPVEYSLEGEGPAVLIVHGGHGNCLSDFKHQALIENGFSVLIPTRPGYGGTPISSGKTAAATAGLFAALLEKLDIASVSVIGVSAGGPTALEFSRLYQELTDKLILEEAVIKPWYHKLTYQYYGVKMIFRPGYQRKFWDNMKKKLATNETKTILDNLKRFTRLDPADVFKTMSAEDINDLKYYIVTGNDSGTGMIFDVEHRASHLEEIRCPTLIMHSVNDGCVNFSHAVYAHRMIKNSELFSAPADSHFIYIGPGSKRVLEKRITFLQGG